MSRSEAEFRDLTRSGDRWRTCLRPPFAQLKALLIKFSLISKIIYVNWRVFGGEREVSGEGLLENGKAQEVKPNFVLAKPELTT